jgi:hypothetical protein
MVGMTQEKIEAKNYRDLIVWQIVIAKELGYIQDTDLTNINSELTELRKKSYALINSLPE